MINTFSLKKRLLFSILIFIVPLWMVISYWMLSNVQSQMQTILDNRLAASANMVGSLLAQYHLEGISQYQQANSMTEKQPVLSSLPASVACRITNIEGSVIAKSQHSPEAIFNTSQDGYSYSEVEGKVWRVYQLTKDNLKIITAEKMEIRKQLMHAFILSTALPFILSLLMSLAVLSLIVHKSMMPLLKLGRSVAERNANSLSPLPVDDAPKEIQPILSEFNKLLLRIEQTLTMERRFTDDAAHELRTPLSGISTQLQVARIQGGQAVEDSLGKAEKALSRLQHMLDQLLLLARIESHKEFDDSAKLSITEITTAAISDVQALAMEKSVKIKSFITNSSLVEVPSQLAIIGVRNILKNAIQFSTNGDSVEIIVSANQTDAYWQVIDQGPGVPPEKLTSIKQRFVHDPKNGNSGLGLAITEAIVTKFSGSLFLENIKTKGFRATLVFPIMMCVNQQK